MSLNRSGRRIRLTCGECSRRRGPSCSRHTDAREGVPTSHLRAGGLVDPLDAGVDDLSAGCAVRPTDDFPLASLVGEAIPDLELHRQNRARGRRCGVGLHLGPWPNHPDYASSREEDLVRTATRTDEGILLPTLGAPDGLFTEDWGAQSPVAPMHRDVGGTSFLLIEKVSMRGHFYRTDREDSSI